MPEPTDILTERRSGRPILPLPRSRSPIKTSLNSAARRSVGPISSPSRPIQHTPIRAASHPAVNRRLDFSTEEVRPSIERSPQKGRRLGAATNAQSTLLSSGLYSDSQESSGKNKKRPFSLRVDEDEESASLTNGGTHEANGTAELDYTTGTADDSMQIMQNDDGEESMPEPPEVPEEEMEDEEPMPIQPPKRKGGRPRKLVSAEIPETNIKPTAARRGRGRAPRSASVDIDASQVSIAATKPGRGRPPRAASVDIDASQVSISTAKPGRGRPPKISKAAVFQDRTGDTSVEEERPAKRAKNGPVNETPRVGRPAKKTKPPPSQRDPNAKVTSAKKAKEIKAASVEPETAPRNNGRPKPRSLQIMRSGTPADDSGSRTTRSGRTSVKPLAYWRNERIVYGEDAAGTKERYLLPTIKEVIRTEEVEPPRGRKATKGRSKAAGRKRTLEDVEEEDEELEPWEMEEGVLRGAVRAWNAGQAADDEDADENGAYTPLVSPCHIASLLSTIRSQADKTNSHQRKSPTRTRRSRHAKYTTAPSNTPRRSPSRSSARAWSTCRPRARRRRRIRARCRWFSSSFTAGSWSR